MNSSSQSQKDNPFLKKTSGDSSLQALIRQDRERLAAIPNQKMVNSFVHSQKQPEWLVDDQSGLTQMPQLNATAKKPQRSPVKLH